ncbi:DUF5683 domain-containing protein [Niabella drilacis]|uniref:DUF5683 domain-containing protein n=1 Tax=Niabella drilacis (strain DSM 25811 / CCM 8410 / CCUG 62505 / LMG 26954 / E90) TaxID=1285928 RepID=A0A1G6TWN2_NIADE|nr:DUF5683 domain-containing protein [Niabella drilacis]SDD33520.1 hypothetical protein SAMN04487894_10863 [Niabella drilacis]
MLQPYKLLFLFPFTSLVSLNTNAQSADSLISAHKPGHTVFPATRIHASKRRNKDIYIDSIALKDPGFRDPNKAMWRSIILPGWGQVYNRKAWKAPIVYAELGTTAGLFVYNYKWFKRFQYAYNVAFNIQNGTDSLTGPNFAKVYERLKRPFFLTGGINGNGLQSRRGAFRQDMDYALVFFLIGWALNVVDATVDAHLSGFNVGSKLSLQVQPPPLNQDTKMGIGLAMQLQ